LSYASSANRSALENGASAIMVNSPRKSAIYVSNA